MSNPYADTELAIYLTRRVLELQPKKSQAEIATEAGYVTPNVISMLKAGSTKLPIDRVPGLARALDCDPAYLLRLALEQNIGSTATRAIYDIVGKPVTENEHGWLEVLREASNNSDPRITARRKSLIFATFGKV